MTGATLEVGPNIVAVLVLVMPIVTVAVNAFILYRTRATGKIVTATATEVAAVHADTIAVNGAVNHKDAGMPTLVQRVAEQDVRGQQLAADLAVATEWQQGALQAIAAGETTLPPVPPKVITPPIAAAKPAP